MKVVDLMTPNPHFVTRDQPLVTAAMLMRDYDIGIVPVVDDPGSRRPVGVVTDRDLVIRHVAAAHHHDCPCGDAMTRGTLACVGPMDDVAEVLRLMRRGAVRRVLVTEPRGRLVGIVAEADLLRHADEIGGEAILDTMRQVAQPAVLQK